MTSEEINDDDIKIEEGIELDNVEVAKDSVCEEDEGKEDDTSFDYNIHKQETVAKEDQSKFKRFLSSDITFVVIILLLLGIGLGVGLGLTLGKGNSNSGSTSSSTASSSGNDNEIVMDNGGWTDVNTEVVEPEIEPTTEDMDTSKEYDAVIIGAGWAGVSAAKELLNAGVTNFLILEAEDYVGGRAKSINSDKSINENLNILSETNIPLEMGAEWLYHNNEIEEYLRYDTNLLDRVDAEDRSDAWKPVGSRIIYRQALDGKTATRLSIEEADELYSDVLERFNSFREGMNDDNTLQDALDFFLDQTNIEDNEKQYLNQVLDAAYIELGTDLDNFYATEGLWYFRGDGMMYLGRQGVGFGNTCRTVASPFVDKVRLGAKVTEINYEDEDDVIISYKQDGIPRKVTAKTVLVTVSLGVLKANTITFTPSLPEDKQDAIDGSTMGVVNKCIMVWKDDVKLPTDEKWFSLITPDDESSGKWTTFFNPSQYKGDVLTLVGWVGGDDALMMEEQSDEEVLDDVMKNLNSIFPTLTRPDEYYISRWRKEENFKGAYSVPTFGRSHRYDSRIISERIGRVFFAGEATAYPNYGSANGAFASGIREANKMIQVLNEER